MLRSLRVGARCRLALLAAVAASTLVIVQVSGVAAAPSDAQGLQVDTAAVQPSNTIYGILYQPHDPAQRKDTGVLVMQNSTDYTHHFACDGLASRGYIVLCANGRYINLATMFIWDNLALDVKSALAFLKQQPGVTHTVLFGHSGGGAVMAYYQNVAENGVGACNDSDKITPCSNELAGMQPADGMILIDGTYGQPGVQLIAWDPKVVEEDQFGRITPSMVDPSLDMFSADNGFDKTNPNYSAAFISKYLAGQAARNERLIALAESRKAAIAAGQGLYPDNEPFIVGYHNADLFSFATNLWSHTKVAHPLITPQGVQNTIVRSIRPIGISVNGDLSVANASYMQGDGLAGVMKSSVNEFLSGDAIHVDPAQYQLTEDDTLGVDWASSNASMPGNVQHIHAPSLFIGATGHYWVVATEQYYDMSPAADKSVAFVFGATHGYTPCQNCGVAMDQIGDTTAETLDYIADWISARFS